MVEFIWIKEEATQICLLRVYLTMDGKLGKWMELGFTHNYKTTLGLGSGGGRHLCVGPVTSVEFTFWIGYYIYLILV